MENLLKQIEELRERVLKTCQLLDIDDLRSRILEIEREVNKPDFWQDQARAIDFNKKLENYQNEVTKWDDINKDIRELEEITAVAQKENDYSFSEEINKRFEDLKIRFNKLEFSVLFSGKYDKNNAVISIHAGTGGVDAQDWAEILERMYLRFAEKMNWQVKILDRSLGQEAGIKNTVIHLEGAWAFGYLRSEAGVHRLVRISPFDAEGMRHTSFALVEVMPELPEAQEIEVQDKDLKIDVFRSSGPGGQSVNTTDSAVRITHLPSGINVVCQNERSQHQNKETALKIIKAKLYKLEQEKKQAEESTAKGQSQMAAWGKQIRSYVFQPYQMIKDHRTACESSNIEAILDGSLEDFMESFLRQERKEKNN